MKALIVSAAFPPLRSGGADYVHRLASELASRAVDVTIITSEEAVLHDPRIRLERVDKRWNWRVVQKCAALVRRYKPDVVDIVFTGWMYHDHPAITFLPDMIKKSSPSVRVVVHIESLGGIRREHSNFARAASRFAASVLAGRSGLSYEYGTLLRDSDAVITLSERDKGELIKYHSQVATKILTVSPPPIMPVVPKMAARQRERERSRLGLSRADDLLLGFYGYIYPGKGIETLFDAVHRLISRGLNVKLMVVGDVPETYVLQREGRPAYLNDLKMLARDLQIFEKVIWSDYEPYGSDEPSKKLRLCDMCIFPFGAGIHEHNSSVWFAAAHGLPLVATRSATTENIFVDGENILFAKSEDSADLATKISELWNCEDLRRKIGANIEILANQKFSWPMCVDNVLGVFLNDR